jgi:hypothetical protein
MKSSQVICHFLSELKRRRFPLLRCCGAATVSRIEWPPLRISVEDFYKTQPNDTISPTIRQGSILPNGFRRLSLHCGGTEGSNPACSSGESDEIGEATADRVDRDAQGVSISRQLAAISLSVHIWITGGQQDRYIARGRGVCGSAGANGALPRRGKPHRLNRSAKPW